MKKILFSILTIVGVTAVVAGATRAYFSDTETSTGNTFAAGTLDLKVNGANEPVAHINLANLTPGDGAGSVGHPIISYQYTLSNSGSITGKPWIEITNVVNKDNACNEVEDDTDTTCGDPGISEGELGNYLLMQVNAAGSGGYEYPHGAGCVDGGRNCPISTWQGFGPVGQGTWENINGGSSTAPMVLEFQLPTTAGNEIQSDSLEFDVVFHLVQV